MVSVGFLCQLVSLGCDERVGRTMKEIKTVDVRMKQKRK